MSDHFRSERLFVWVEVKDRSTGLPYSKGYWSDVGGITANVLSLVSGQVEARAFDGSAGLIDVSPRVSTVGLSVEPLTITASHIADLPALVQGYDIHGGRIEVFRGEFVAGTQVQVGPAEPVFIGQISVPDIQLPKVGETGEIRLECVTAAQQFVSSNSVTKSDALQRSRNATDSFRRHASSIADWNDQWMM